MRNTLALSLRALRRDWRAGELRILVIALVIAVASMTAVGFFNDRIRKAMDQQAAELLAADLVLASSDPLRGERLEQARLLGLRSAETLSFRSVLQVGDKTQLVEVKAVSPGYPLRGLLRAAAAPFAPDEAVRDMATQLFIEGLNATKTFRSPRALAFVLIGLHAYLESYGGDATCRKGQDQVKSGEARLPCLNATAGSRPDAHPWLRAGRGGGHEHQ